MNRRILVISDLDVWTFTMDAESTAGVGNQSLYNTLVGFEAAGWDVHLMTATGIHNGLDHINERITVERVNLTAQEPVRRYRQLRKMVEGLVAGSQNDVKSSALQPAISAAEIENRKRWLMFQVEMSIRAVLRCMKVMPDVIYGHEIYGAPVAANVGKLLGIASVSRFQGTLLGKWVATPKVFETMPVNSAALRSTTDMTVMADDGTLGDEVLRALGVDMAKVRFWINGQDKDLVAAAIERNGPRVWRAPEPVRIFTASRLVNWKRVDRTLTILSKLPADIPSWRLEIAGDGADRAALEKMAADLGIASRVKFLGAIPHDQVLDHMVQSDIVVGMNEISNLSNSILEAMVAGKAVIAAAAGATDHVVTNGKTGILVPENMLNTDGVEQMADLIAMPELRAELGDAAAKWAKTGIRTWAERMQLEIADIEKLLGRERLPLVGFLGL
jgi:glycosyltransferase involved in cell wall biosynthesis